METSAKDSTNVEHAFMAMCAAIKNRYFLYSHLEYCLICGWSSSRTRHAHATQSLVSIISCLGILDVTLS